MHIEIQAISENVFRLLTWRKRGCSGASLNWEAFMGGALASVGGSSNAGSMDGLRNRAI